MLTLMPPKSFITSELQISSPLEQTCLPDQLQSKTSPERTSEESVQPEIQTLLNSPLTIDFESSSSTSSTPMSEPRQIWTSELRICSDEDIRINTQDEIPITPELNHQYQFSKTELYPPPLDYEVYRNKILEAIFKSRYSEKQPPGSVVFNYFHLCGVNSSEKILQHEKAKELGLWDVFDASSPSEESCSGYTGEKDVKRPADYFLIKGNQKYPTVEKSTDTKVTSQPSLQTEYIKVESVNTLIPDKPMTPRLKNSTSKRFSESDATNSTKQPAKWCSAGTNSKLTNPIIGQRMQITRQMYGRSTPQKLIPEPINIPDNLRQITQRPKTADSRLYNERFVGCKTYDNYGRRPDSSSDNSSVCDYLKTNRTKSFHGKTSRARPISSPTEKSPPQIWLAGKSDNSFNRKYAKSKKLEKRKCSKSAPHPYFERLVLHHDQRNKNKISEMPCPPSPLPRSPEEKKVEVIVPGQRSNWEPLIEDESEIISEDDPWTKNISDNNPKIENICKESINKLKAHLTEKLSNSSIYSNNLLNSSQINDSNASASAYTPRRPRSRRRSEPSRLPTSIRKPSFSSDVIKNDLAKLKESMKSAEAAEVFQKEIPPTPQHSNTKNYARPRTPFRPLIEALERSAKAKVPHIPVRERNSFDQHCGAPEKFQLDDAENNSLQDRLKMFKSPVTESFLKGLVSEKQLNITEPEEIVPELVEIVTEKPIRPVNTWGKYVKNCHFKCKEKKNDNEKPLMSHLKSTIRQKYPVNHRETKEPDASAPLQEPSDLEESLDAEESKNNFEKNANETSTPKSNSKVCLAMQVGLRLYIKKLKSILSDRNATVDDLQHLANTNLPDAVAPNVQSLLNKDEVHHLRRLLAAAEKAGKHGESSLLFKFAK